MSTDAEEEPRLRDLMVLSGWAVPSKLIRRSLAKIEVRHLVGVGETTASLAATKLTEFARQSVGRRELITR